MQIDDICAGGLVLAVQEAVEALLEAAPYLVVFTFDHAQVHKPSLNNRCHVRVSPAEVLLRGVALHELCECGVYAVLLPDIK